MDWDQLRGWIAYAELEPFGEQRGDIRASFVGTAICNTIGRANGMKRDMFKPMDLMPRYGDDTLPTKKGNKVGERKPITSDEQWGAFANVISSIGNEEDPSRRRRTQPPKKKGLNMSARRRRELEAKGLLPPEPVE